MAIFMKGISTTVSTMVDLGWKEIHSEEKGESYDVDEAHLLKNGRKFAMVSATGCSCWDGNVEGWIELTKVAIMKIAKTWASGPAARAEKALGEWILKNKKKL